MTTPTVGMLIKFQPTQFPNDPLPPLLDAEVMHFAPPSTVDLEITAGNGTPYIQQNVPLLQAGEAAPASGASFARMPA